MERGWKPDPALVLDGDAPCDAVHPAAGLLAKVQVAATPRAAATTTPQPSFELRVPEGILAEMVDYMVSTARPAAAAARRSAPASARSAR